MARSSSGSGRRPLKAEITSSNLVRATKCSTRVARPGIFVVNPSARYRLSRLKGRLLCIDPRPGNTTAPTPRGRRPTPTRSLRPDPPPEVGRPPQSPPHSKPAGCPIPHAKPAALTPSLKADRQPRPPRETEAPDRFGAEGESPRPAPADRRMGQDGASARSRYATPPNANRGRSGLNAALPACFPSPHLSDRGGSTCPSWQHCDIGCIFSEVPPAPVKIRSIAQHFPRKSPSPPPA